MFRFNIELSHPDPKGRGNPLGGINWRSCFNTLFIIYTIYHLPMYEAYLPHPVALLLQFMRYSIVLTSIAVFFVAVGYEQLAHDPAFADG